MKSKVHPRIGRCCGIQPPIHATAGYSLVELLVTLVILGVLLLGATTLLSTTDRVSTSQVGISGLQTNHRVAQHELNRMVAMAGVGGLAATVPPALAGGSAAGVLPDGLALGVRNNVAAGYRVGDAGTPLVVEGTDVVTVRGVFSTPVLFIEPQAPLTLVNGRISIVLQKTVDVGVEQDLEPLREVLISAKADSRPEALIVRDRSNPEAFAVMELDPSATIPGAAGDATLTVGLVLSETGGAQQYSSEYGRMILGTALVPGSSGTQVTLPDTTRVQIPAAIGTIGLLEEYRFYVRDEHEIDGDATSRPTPVLARARFYPNTADMHPEGSIDLAEGIADLQVALGVDLPPTDGQILDAGDDTDEVLYNHPDDDDGLTPAPPAGAAPWAVPDARIFFARVNLVAQAAHPDRDFEGVILGAIEDHDHADPLGPSIFNTGPNPKVRKRHLQTIVEMRNLP